MKLKLVLLACLFQGFVFAQSHQRYSQLNFSQGIQNPAALAIDAPYQIDLMGRNQWFQFEGAPTTVATNFQAEVDFDMAVGLNVYHDRIGATQNNSFMGQYAYRLVFDRSNAMIFGLGLGLESKTSDLTGSTLTEAGDPAFAQSYSKVFFQSSFGMYYYSPKFYIGLSIPSMFQNNFGFEDGFNPARFHYYGSTGFYLEAGENYTFNPNIQVKYVWGAPVQADIILRNTLYGRFSVVVGYRTENSIIAGIDMLITPFMRAGYSFNYDVGSLARVKGVSNEIHIGFGLPFHNSRYDFGRRRYIGHKGRFSRELKHKARRKKKYQGG
jgi:type IX secretion system PorP/SprF family membrane protein